MRRADRLFQVIQVMRRRPVVTAAALANHLEVSERTIYRDIRDLVASGVPIEGEAGVGYTLRKGFDLPPLMFTEDEVEAMVLGARVVSSWADPALARAAESALARVEAAVPDRLKQKLTGSRLYAPAFHVRSEVVAALADMRAAVEAQRKVHMSYSDANSALTERTVRPLGLFFWGGTWTLAGWCELRTDFRDFRLDRILDYQVLDQRFDPEPGTTLEDFFAAMHDEGT